MKRRKRRLRQSSPTRCSRAGLGYTGPSMTKTGSSLARDRGEALCQAVAPKRLNDEIDEHACLGRQQRARGVIDRDRSAVAIPLRQDAHECAALLGLGVTLIALPHALPHLERGTLPQDRRE
jgi:hypothetical protein